MSKSLEPIRIKLRERSLNKIKPTDGAIVKPSIKDMVKKLKLSRFEKIKNRRS